MPVVPAARRFDAAKEIRDEVGQEEVPGHLVVDVLVDVLLSAAAVAVVFRGGEDQNGRNEEAYYGRDDRERQESCQRFLLFPKLEELVEEEGEKEGAHIRHPLDDADQKAETDESACNYALAHGSQGELVPGAEGKMLHP